VAPPASLQTVLQSPTSASLIAAFLSVADLLIASALSRSLHAVFDSDEVWQDRLRVVEAIRRVEDGYVVPPSALLSPAQLAALPPLPSLPEVASLCLQSFEKAIDKRGLRIKWRGVLQSKSGRGLWMWTARHRLLASPPSSNCRPLSATTVESCDRTIEEICSLVHHVEFTLAYSCEEGKWKVESMGDDNSGMRAINIDDNIQRTDTSEEEQSDGVEGSDSKQMEEDENENDEQDEEGKQVEEKRDEENSDDREDENNADSGSLHLLVKVKQEVENEHREKEEDESMHLLAAAARVKVLRTTSWSRRSRKATTSQHPHSLLLPALAAAPAAVSSATSTCSGAASTCTTSATGCCRHHHLSNHRLSMQRRPRLRRESAVNDRRTVQRRKTPGVQFSPCLSASSLCRLSHCHRSLHRRSGRGHAGPERGSIAGITRINHSTYEIAEVKEWPKLRHFRCCIRYTPPAEVESRNANIRSWKQPRGEVVYAKRRKVYEISLRYETSLARPALRSIVYEAECNVCARCENRITESGRGHSADCHKPKKTNRMIRSTTARPFELDFRVRRT